jgi:DNA-binding transcriptional MerR regulator
MELLDIVAAAKSLGLPVETVERYASRLILIVPAVRAGSRLLYPPEGVTLLGEIHDAIESGAELDEIEVSLQQHFPVTVISPGNQHPQHGSATGETEAASIVSLLSGLPTATQIDQLRKETAQLRALLAERDARQELTREIISAEVRSMTEDLRTEIACLREELQNLHAETAPLIVSTSNGAHASEPAAKERNGRVPRRMGQPLRAQNSSN